MSKRIFIFAGEKSGDLIGGNLLKALNDRLSHYSIEGVGGPEMRAHQLDCLMRMEEFEVMGFSDILWSLPKLYKQFRIVRDHILNTKPEVVIFIDYPGFNLRMAKALRTKGYKGKLVQYISPTVWAWGEHRKDHMAKTLDLLLTIYPFEKAYFSDTSLKVTYVGNPVKEAIDHHRYDDNWASLFGIREPENLIAIFPGSRQSEIHLNLPYQLKTAELLKQDDPNARFAISCAHEKIMPTMHDILRNNSLKLNQDIFLLPKAYSYELMRDCRSAIAKSGTVTLELALHQRPAVVVYKLTRLNRLIAQYILKLNLPHYCIVNILSRKTVYSEIIEKGLTPQNLFSEMKKIHDDTEDRQRCIDACTKIPDILQENQPCPLGQGNDLSGRGLDPSHPNFKKTPPLREGSPNASPRREDDASTQAALAIEELIS